MARRAYSISGNLNEFKSDYEQARNSHLRRPRLGVPLSGGAGAEWHLRNEAHWLNIIELARALDRDSPVIRQALNRVCDKVGGHFQIHSDTGDEGLNEALEAEVYEWSEDKSKCDAKGQRVLREIAWQAARHIEMDGDCFVLPLQEGFLGTYEAHRFRSATRSKTTGSHGIETNGHGRPVRYHMTSGDMGFNSQVTMSQLNAIPAYDDQGNEQVFHLCRPERFSTHRGISVMAPVLDITSYHDDTTFATCISAQLQTFFAIIHEFAAAGGQMPSIKGQKKGEQSTQNLSDGTQALIEKVYGPIEVFAQAGEKIHGFSPTIPGVQFTPFMWHLLGLIACNLGIPLAVLLLDARSELAGSYSAWRGAMNEAREGIKKKQQYLVTHFYAPVYRWRLRRLIAEDTAFARAAERLKAKFFAHEWKPPAPAYMDPMKDVAADVMRGETAQSSLERIFADNGQDFEPEMKTWIGNRSFQITEAIKACEAINKAFSDLDDKPTWRDLFPLIGGQAGATLINESHKADDPLPPTPTPALKPKPKQEANG